MSSGRLRARAHRDEGFTLIELLLVIAILGIVVVPLSAALLIGLRTTGATANRVTSTHDAQLVSIYLPADIQSAGSAADDVVTAPGNTDCSGTSNLVRLRWTDYPPGSGPTYVAAYTIRQQGDEWQLVRDYCTDGTLSTETVVAHNLAGPTAGSASQYLQLVSVTLTEAKTPRETANYQYTISGTRRTPATP